ncbi:cation:proton antiporter, partial [Candidatus Kaiserbacteria bacterium]|nr:cation:proton antiporter [Candidatus Kaiserbacteria bacterium]
EHDADTAFFFAVPLFAFVIALGFGGSGYLAAFLVGLFLGTIQHLHKTETFLGRSIEAFLKPAIFVILGAMVNIGDLIAYAPIGIIAALVFMFVIRPFAVFLSLSIWLHNGKRRMDVRDLLFLSFVRETGAIPAALLITLVGKGIGGVALVPIGMWVILATLVIQPMCTPYVARKLGIAD